MSLNPWLFRGVAWGLRRMLARLWPAGAAAAFEVLPESGDATRRTKPWVGGHRCIVSVAATSEAFTTPRPCRGHTAVSVYEHSARSVLRRVRPDV